MSDELNNQETPETAQSPIEAVAQPANIADLKPKMKVRGKVARIELYGAFIDLGIGSDAILHVSQLGDRPVNRVSEVLSPGQEVEVWIDTVDPERKQVTVTMIEPLAVGWADLKPGQVYEGVVKRLENFGAFVDIGAEKEGLVHVSELSHGYVKHPSEVVRPGDEVQVKVLSFQKRKRRINLSMKALMEPPAQAPAPQEVVQEAYEAYDEPVEMPTAMEIALRRALGEDALRPERSRKRRNKRSQRRAEQEEIIARTLDLSKEG